MQDKIEVRRGKIADLDAFYNLWKRSLKDGYFLYPKSSIPYIIEKTLPKGELKNNIKSGKKIFYLAYSGKNLVGYLLTNKQDGGVAFGHWLAVAADFRNQGVASKLLSFWEKAALAEGAHKLDLYTTRNDVGFYKKLGFTLAGECPDCWYGVDHFWFYKTLRKSDEKLFLRDFFESEGEIKKSRAGN